MINTVGKIVKINQMLYGENPKYDDMVGDLGYVGVFMYFNFEIMRIETDPNRGEIAHCKIINPDVLVGIIPGVKEVKYEGELVLLTKDLVPANMKTTLVYLIEELKNPSAATVTQLLKDRKKMQAQGKVKGSKDMKDNWQAITSARSAGDLNKVRVHIPSQRICFDMTKKELPSNEEKSISEFKMKLAGMLRKVRQERKQVNPAEVKSVDIFGIAVEKRGGVFSTANSLLKAYEESLKSSLETPKKPVDAKANYVGIEIEFIYQGDYDKLKKLLIERRLHRYIDLTSDGSLQACHNTGYQTKEMRIICKNKEVRTVLLALQSVFDHPSVDAYVNRSCGLHVHLDMRNRNASNCFTNLVRLQPLLRGAQPSGRVKNKHCLPNVKDVIKFEAGVGFDVPRYSVINASAWSKHTTLEVRIHEGTTDCAGIASWVEFLDTIVSHDSVIPANSVKLAQEAEDKFDFGFSDEAIDYVDSRIKRFNSLSAG